MGHINSDLLLVIGKTVMGIGWDCSRSEIVITFSDDTAIIIKGDPMLIATFVPDNKKHQLEPIGGD